MTSPQLPLGLRFPPDQRLDSFVGDPAALALLRALAQHSSEAWLLVTGAPGSGKTHVLVGCCAAAEACGRRAVYLPLASAAGALPQALARLEGADLVALDGLDAVLGQRGEEIALFDFHNRARSSGTTVLYSASAAAAALPFALPDLKSRIGQCAHLPLPALGEDARRAVLRERAARRGLVLDDGVLDYLFRRVGRDLGGLVHLLERIDRESLAAQRRVTVPFLRRLLGD